MTAHMHRDNIARIEVRIALERLLVALAGRSAPQMNMAFIANHTSVEVLV